MDSRPGRSFLLGLAALLVFLPLGCGGGGGGGGGDAGTGGGGESTLVKKVSTPLGAQGNLGDLSDPVNAHVDILFNLADKEYSKVDVLIEFAVDWNGDGLVTPDEWRECTSAAGYGDGTPGLTPSPGSGARHRFVWDSFADIGPGRFVTLDFKYDASGRLVTAADGSPEYASYPGCRVKITVKDENASTRETNPFDVSNNSTPLIAPDLRIDGLFEGIAVYYKPVDANGDAISVAVDYSTDVGTTWLPATPAPGTIISGVPAATTEAAAVEQTERKKRADEFKQRYAE